MLRFPSKYFYLGPLILSRKLTMLWGLNPRMSIVRLNFPAVGKVVAVLKSQQHAKVELQSRGRVGLRRGCVTRNLLSLRHCFDLTRRRRTDFAGFQLLLDQEDCQEVA